MNAVDARDPLLSIDGLSVPIPGNGDRRFAVRDLTLALHAGEILCVVGESGSGKSVCAQAVMGLLAPDMTPSAGRVLFDGQDLLRLPEARLREIRGARIGMIFQEPMSALNPVMRIGDQIAEALQVHGTTDPAAVRARVLELLRVVGLVDASSAPQAWLDAYPFRLSGGQRQRVMIAIALAMSPSILIADEPTTALDVTTQAQILALIAELQRAPRSGPPMGVLFITHDFGVVADIADRIAVMERGELVELGNARQVLDAPRHDYTRRLIAAVPRRRHGRPADAGEGPGPEAGAGSEARAGAGASVGATVQPSPPVLAARALHKTFTTGGRSVQALADVSFELRRGETLGVVGESGSGKSTLGRCLLKLVEPDSGRIELDGVDVTALSQRAFRPMRRGIQMVFQDPYASLNPRHTVGRIVSDGPIAHGVPRADAHARARRLLELVGLDASAFDRYPNAFSGGQRQRVGIARALALEPRVLVADESVSALDVSVQAQVLALLHGLQRRLSLAMLFITHDLRVAAQVSDRILVMQAGRVVEEGAPARLFDAPAHPYTRQLMAAIPGQRWNPTVSESVPTWP